MNLDAHQSIQGLQYAAQQVFGHQGRLKLYHHGTTPLINPQQMARIKDQDVIVVTWDDRRLTADEFEAITAYRQDYVQHPIEPRAMPSPTPRPTPRPFEGSTSYQQDYVKHPPSARDPFRTPPVWSPSPSPTGQTTYASMHPWYDAETRQAFAPPASRAPSVPFEGHSSYSHDYVRHPLDPRATPPPRKRPPSAPFEGRSTYDSEFVPHAARPRSACRPPRTRQPHAPFVGDTEYTQEYIKKDVPRGFCVHLEPEVGIS